MVNNARVTSMDHSCENGVVHKIDQVLVPPQDSIMDYIAKDPELRLPQSIVFTYVSFVDLY